MKIAWKGIRGWFSRILGELQKALDWSKQPIQTDYRLSEDDEQEEPVWTTEDYIAEEKPLPDEGQPWPEF